MNEIYKRTPIMIAIVIFTLIAIVIYHFRPRLMFDEDGEIRNFGFEKNQTVFTYPIVLGVVALFTYLITFIAVSFYNRGNM